MDEPTEKFVEQTIRDMHLSNPCSARYAVTEVTVELDETECKSTCPCIVNYDDIHVSELLQAMDQNSFLCPQVYVNGKLGLALIRSSLMHEEMAKQWAAFKQKPIEATHVLPTLKQLQQSGVDITKPLSDVYKALVVMNRKTFLSDPSVSVSLPWIYWDRDCKTLVVNVWDFKTIFKHNLVDTLFLRELYSISGVQDVTISKPREPISATNFTLRVIFGNKKVLSMQKAPKLRVYMKEALKIKRLKRLLRQKKHA